MICISTTDRSTSITIKPGMLIEIHGAVYAINDYDVTDADEKDDFHGTLALRLVPASEWEKTPMYYIVASDDTEGLTIIVKTETEPADYLQGPFATLEEARDTDWDAIYAV